MAEITNLFVYNCEKIRIVAQKSSGSTVWYKIMVDDAELATVFHPQATEGVWPLIVLPERPGEEKKDG